jgi:hypothetical protein
MAGSQAKEIASVRTAMQLHCPKKEVQIFAV